MADGQVPADDLALIPKEKTTISPVVRPADDQGLKADGEVAATSIQAAHRGHSARVKSNKKKSSLVIQGTKPQVDFYAQVPPTPQPNAAAGTDRFIPVPQESGLDHMELNVVYAAFQNKARGEGVTLDEFIHEMKGLRLSLRGGEDMLRGLFASLDVDKSGAISIEELTAGISLFTKGSRADKLAVCFQIYDTDQSGGISKEELSLLFRAEVLSGLKAIHASVEFDAIDAEAGNKVAKVDVKEALGGLTVATAEEGEGGKVTIAVSSPTGGKGQAVVDATQLLATEIPDLFHALRGEEIVADLVAQAFREADKDDDERIDLAEFVKFCKKHPKLTDWFDILAV